MSTYVTRILSISVIFALLTAASFAAPQGRSATASPSPEEDPAVTADAGGATGTLREAPTKDESGLPVGEQAEPLPPGDVLFRPPKRPSQLKPVRVSESDASETAREESSPAEQQPTDQQPGQHPQEQIPQRLQEVDESPSEQPQTAAEPEIATMSFSGVEPGKTTVAELKTAWGDPAAESASDGITLLTFDIPPFKKVDVTTENDQVTSIVVHLDPPMLVSHVVDELKLRTFESVLIPDATGQLLGQAYPERGALFGFAPDKDLPHVAQIVIEPISGESFVLRALYDFSHRYADDLKDVDFALGLDDGDARAHWVKSRVLGELGRYEQSLTSAKRAAELDPTTSIYRVQQARVLRLAGRYDEAAELLAKVLAETDLAQHVQAETQCELGWTLAHRPVPDHKASIEHFQAAIAVATPLADQRLFEVRRAAKRALVEATAGIGYNVAWGNYQRKAEVTAKWLERALAYADQYGRGDNGPKDLLLQVLAQQLATYAGMGAESDPTQAAEAAIQEGRRLIAWSKDPLFKQQVEWLLGSALIDAMRIEHARGQHLDALRYSDMAVPMLESTVPQRELSAREQFALGRFYFLTGAVYAVAKQDHPEAAGWYEKALPLLTNPAAAPADATAVGRLGEWLVSVGVTLWEVKQPERALEMTERGADLMKQAVARKVMKESALAVPYANLAAMHRAQGSTDKADEYGRQAKRLESAAQEATLR